MTAWRFYLHTVNVKTIIVNYYFDMAARFHLFLNARKSPGGYAKNSDRVPASAEVG